MVLSHCGGLGGVGEEVEILYRDHLLPSLQTSTQSAKYLCIVLGTQPTV